MVGQKFVQKSNKFFYRGGPVIRIGHGGPKFALLAFYTPQEIEECHIEQVRRLRWIILANNEIEGGHFWQVRRYRGVILDRLGD